MESNILRKTLTPCASIPVRLKLLWNGGPFTRSLALLFWSTSALNAFFPLMLSASGFLLLAIGKSTGAAERNSHGGSRSVLPRMNNLGEQRWNIWDTVRKW